MSHSIELALQRFHVTQKELQHVLNVAMEKGADYADIYFEHEVSSQLKLTDNDVNAASNTIDFGAGVRVIMGDQTGYSYTEDISLDTLIKAAKTANLIAQSPTLSKCQDLTPLKTPNNFYPMIQSWEDCNVIHRKKVLEKLNNRLFELDSRVKKVVVQEMDAVAHTLIANTEGCLYADTVPMGIIMASCLMNQGDTIEQGGASRSFRMGFEMLSDALIEEIAQEAIAKTAILFEAKQPQGGVMPVVMGAGASGILLHEAIGHAFEADFIRKKTSIFTDKMGQQICDKHINVVDDATIPNNRGSINVDDEGVEGQKTYIVKEGILNSFLHDRISAKHFNVTPTGNGRRESFRSVPMPRMRATYMEDGNLQEEALIQSVKQGVYVDNFSNGQVQIGAGDFTFYVKSGYLIEDGKLTQPIKDINIIGNGPEALGDIDMVASNSKIDNGTWTCGKDGQSCAVTCGMPSVRVKKLTVGGLN